MADSLRDEKARALAEQVTEAVRNRRDGKDGKDGQLIVQADDAAVRALKEELATLKAQALQPDNDSKAIPIAIGRLGEEDQRQSKEIQAAVDRLERLEKFLASFQDSQQFVLPRAFAELIERVKKLEQVDITPAEPAELQQEIDDMGRALADMSAAVINHIATLQKRLDACESRFTDLPQVLTDLQTQRRATR